MDRLCVCGRPCCLQGVNTTRRLEKACNAWKAPRARRRARPKRWGRKGPVVESGPLVEGPNPFEAFRNPAVVMAQETG